MKRREFITLLGGMAAAWPLAARAQHAGNRATIGLLNANTGQTTDALVGRLRELGWSEGRNLTIEYRWPDGRSKHLPKLAAELVARKVDLIVAAGTPSVLAVKHATSTIPIVFVGIADPVGIGVVESLARPGGNATGVSQQATDTGGKRLELLYEAVGGLRRVAVLVNVGNLYTPLEIKEVAVAAGNLGIELVAVEVRRVEDIVPALIAIRGQVQALYVPGDGLLFTHRVRVITVALAGRLPTIHNFREHVDAQTIRKPPKTAFQPGCAPGPGRPKGMRNRLTEIALQALGEDFAEHGPAVIAQVRREKPHHYLSIVASLLPRQVQTERLSKFSDISDEELDQLEEYLRASRAQLVLELEQNGAAIPLEPKDAKQQDS